MIKGAPLSLLVVGVEFKGTKICLSLGMVSESLPVLHIKLIQTPCQVKENDLTKVWRNWDSVPPEYYSEWHEFEILQDPLGS